MTYDPTLTPKEQDEAESVGVIYRVEVRTKKSRFDKIKTIFENLSMDEDSVKAFYYAMKSNVLYLIQGLIGVVTFTLWEPNLTTRAITLRAKHSAIARQHRNEKEKAQLIKESELIDAIKAESAPKEPVLSEDEKMEDWLKRYKEV